MTLVAEIIRITRFGLVGLANTAITFVVILSGLSLGLGDYYSNMVGFVAGIVFSYTLNTIWTFQAGGSLGRALFLRFLAVTALAYFANLVLILAARSFGFIDNPVSHLAGMAVYTPICYAGLRIFVYAPRR